MMSSNYTPIDNQNVSGSVPSVTDSSGNVTVKFAESNLQTNASRAAQGKISGGSGPPPDADDLEGDDLWSDAEDMERQWQGRHKQFHTIGYREGLMAGKEASAQEGFNVGFRDSVFVGQTWGLVRGVTSALAHVPDALKEKLVETDEKRNRLQHLHESVRDISTTDALELFYERLNNGISEQRENVETSYCTGDLRSHFSEDNILENHVQEFKMLALECPALTLHLLDGG